MPWLNRELISLVRNANQSAGTLLGTLDGLIRSHDITSRTFRRRVHIFILQYTDHFIHELTNFARSPYDMIGYDRNVMYAPMFDDEVINIAAQSSSDENDVVVAVDPPEPVLPTNSVITENRVAETGDAVNTEPIPSGSGESSQAATSSSSTERGPVIKNSVNASNLVSTVIESSSDSSDIYISNEGSAFAPVNYRTTCGARNSGPVIRLETTIIYSSSESDESEEVKTLSQLQGHAGPTFDSTGGRISPKSLIVSTSGRTVIVGMNFGERAGSSSEPRDPNTASTSSSTATPGGTVTKTESPASPSPSVAAEGDEAGSSQAPGTSATANAEPPAAAPVEPAPIQPANVVDESDSDVEFVCAKKPPHLRTPEYVELNSDSDSDVVFVNEEFLPRPPPVKVEAQLDPGLWNLDLNDELVSNLSMPSFSLDSPAASEPGKSNQDRRRNNRRDNDSRFEMSYPIWGDNSLRMLPKTVIKFKNPPFALSIEPNAMENQPSTSQGPRHRRHPRYLKHYLQLKQAAENSDSDDSDSDNDVPLKRLIYQKVSGSKNIFEQSSSNSSTGPDSTDGDGGASLDESTATEMSSSSHEEFKLESKRKPAARKPKATKATKPATKSPSKSTDKKLKRTKKTKKRKISKSRNIDDAPKKKSRRIIPTPSSSSSSEEA